MMRIVKVISRIQLLAVITAILFVSCLDNEQEELQANHDRRMEEMKITYGFTEKDTLPGGYGVYIKYSIVGDTNNPVRPTLNDIVVIDYVGTNYEGIVFDVSRRDIAEAEDIYDDEFIYGPGRFYVSNLFLGFQLAIPDMPLGSKAQILVPGNLWNGYYFPVLYEIELYQIIEDIDVYNELMISRYLDSLDIAVYDTLPSSDGIWAKDFSLREPPDTITYGDTILLRLHGYYVEADDTYMNSFPGRQFFPIATSGDSVTMLYGSYGPDIFPYTYAVNELVNYMDIGETVDMVTSSEYGYDVDGFHHPYTGSYIVPADMPLHYTVELLDVRKASK